MCLKRFIGRIAVVTASTDGIGLAIARRLAQEGAKVIISSRKQKNVERATKQLQDEGFEIKSLVCHVSNAEDRRKLFEEAVKIGGLDILVNNAGVNPHIGGILDCPEDKWDKIFDVNLKASYLLAKEALPLLKNSKAGRIIYIGSIGSFNANNHIGAYGVSKTALLGLVKAASVQLASNNITVNSIVPGFIDTNFSKILVTTEEIKKELPKILLGRIGLPKEIAGAVAFLASDDGSYVTGENIIVSGGMKVKGLHRFEAKIDQFPM